MKAHEWVANAYNFELSDFHKIAIDLLCRSQGCGPYDLKCWSKEAFSMPDAAFFKVSYPRLATFDGDGLTTLVIGAHEECIRVSISPIHFKMVEIAMHKRDGREGSISRRHPTIDDAVTMYLRDIAIESTQ